MAVFPIDVIVNPDSARRGINQVERGLGRLQGQANSLAGALGGAFAALGVGLGATSAIQTIAQFSQELSTVAGITNATAEQFERLRARAEELGATTRFSATQAAEGLSFLARAGFNVEQSIDTVDDALRLAQAGALDLGRAADIASNVLTGFRLNTSQAGRVVDVLASAANNANTDVNQLGEAFKFVAPVAAGVGVDLEEAAAAIAELSNAGLQASLAGTGLRRILSELEAPATLTVRILNQLGVTTEEVRVSQVGLTAALQRLAAAGVDTATALEIFGDRGGPAFEVLSNGLPNVQRLNKLFDESAGTAERLARVMDDNLNGAILSLSSAAEGLVLSLGRQGVEGGLRAAFETITLGIRELSANSDTLINVLESIVTLLAIRFAAFAIPAAIAGLRALAAAAIANPVGAFFAAISLGISILVGFGEELRIAGDSLATVQDFFVAFGNEVAPILQEVFAAIGELFSDFGKSASDSTSEGLGSFQSFALGVAAVLEAVAGGIGGIISFFQQLGPAIAEAVTNALNALLDRFEETFDGIRALGETIQAFFSTLFFAIVSSIRELGVAARLAASRQFDEAAQAASEAGDIFANNVERAFTQNGQVLNNALIRLGNERSLPQVEQQFEGAGNRLGAAFTAGYEQVTSDFSPTSVVLRSIEAAEAAAANRAAEEAGRRAAAAAGAGAAVIAPLPTISLAPEAIAPDLRAQRDLFAEVLQQLEQERSLLAIIGPQRDVRAEALRIENELRREGITLNAAQQEQLQTELQRLAQLQLQADILEDLRGPQIELEQRVAAINTLFEQGKISVDEYNLALSRVSEVSANATGTLGEGFANGLARAREGLRDVASLASNTVVNAVQGAEDALVQFATTGELSFSGLVDSILSDLARLLARQALGGLFDLLGGGIGGAAGGGGGGLFGLLGFREDGGPVQGNRPFVVGEGGPELFVPSGSGNIIPAPQTAAMRAAQTTINVSPAMVNVSVNVDPQGRATITQEIQSREGEQAVLEVIRRNPRAINRLTN